MADPAPDDEREEDDGEALDRIYSQGCAAVYRELLGVALRGLGRPSTGPDATPDELRARIGVLESERSSAIELLRELCEAHGDNDWTDELHLRNILDKHLGRYLDGE